MPVSTTSAKTLQSSQKCKLYIIQKIALEASHSCLVQCSTKQQVVNISMKRDGSKAVWSCAM